jgi:hypothetical protein
VVALAWYEHATSPWRTACGFQSGAKSYSTAGHIWIR